MKKFTTVVLGLSLFASAALYASGGHGQKVQETNNHMGDHMMTNGKMGNHMNKNGMTNDQMQKNMKSYHHKMMTNGYEVTFNSSKPLTDGKNHMTVMLKKNGKAVKNAKVNIKFSMPSMPGMEFTENAMSHGNMYKSKVNFSMGGMWAYDLMFKTSDGSMHKTKGSVNIK